MLDDKRIDAILCARGGYGLSRIIDKLDFKKFRKKPKWIVGFSDVTILQAHVYRRFNIASIHSPMAAAFNDEEYKNEYVQSLQKALTGKKAKYQVLPHEFNKTGKCSARLVGGNLALLAHLAGTPSEFKTAGKILFLEDVGEYIYSIDRMLYQLKRSGKLDRLAGLIVGKFTDVKDTTIPFGKNAYQVIHDAVKEYDFPVCFQFPVSHEKENYALKIGAAYKFAVSEQGVTLKEL
jgi:muramoyltetrapeptide carboxypeptidase